ncbi:MAG TPA: TIGR03435 family protein [Bryobacteraceae bacterium]|jgi:uncharacterized protein (TIGR03435 family)|nr:TIGR03435 family protein [Bryobacteraceae bacterium]
MSTRSIEAFSARSILLVLASNCCLLAQSQVSQPREFEAVSVKPHISSGAPDERAGIEEDKALVRIDNLSLRRLIGIAYRVKGFQIAGPDWPETFDIVAKLPTDYQHDQLPALMQRMLSDRFRLAVHHETRTAPAYALVIAKGGPKLHESAGPRTYHTGRPGLVEGHQWSMTELADSLTGFVGAPVANQTGLGAVYDLKIEWNPQELAQSETRSATEGPSLFTALQEQLGLRLEPTRAPFDFVVVDRAERVPIPN